MEKELIPENVEQDEYLIFDEDDMESKSASDTMWKILIVDDEDEVHKVTKMVLSSLQYENRGVTFLSAYSGQEAKKILADNPDMAVILLDVVMEHDYSGLELVRFIREELKNTLVRIILRTGQPGQAPEEKVILEYDINDYKEKTELTSKKLFTAVISALRSYRDLKNIYFSRKGLEKIIESSSTIFKLQSMREFASGVLTQLTSVLHLDKDAFYCKTMNPRAEETDGLGGFYIMAATGDYYSLIDESIREVIPKEILGCIEKSYREKTNVVTDQYAVIYFKSKLDTESLIFVKSMNRLTDWDRYLLEYFCTHVSTAFDNIYLSQEIMDNLKEPIMVIDNNHKIVNYNQAFSEMFIKRNNNQAFEDTAAFVRMLREKALEQQNLSPLFHAIEQGVTENVRGELVFDEAENPCFYLNIQLIVSANDEVIGRVVTFNDISEYKRLLDVLNTKNIELSEANKKLEEYAAAVEELVTIKERNRFARDVHDTLGHTMALLIAMLEVSTINLKKDPSKAEEKLIEATNMAREGLKELRRSISGLVPEKLETNSLVRSLEKLVEDFKGSGIQIELSIEGYESFKNPAYSDAVYRLCQEALTNSLRHGKAKNITIILKLVDNLIKLFIFDDGIGCKKIQKGFGLTGMEHRVGSLGGSINYGSDGEKGFNIQVMLPILEP